MLDAIAESGARLDGAISLWVLQHCFQPAEDIASIRRALKPNGSLFVLNNLNRAIPGQLDGQFRWFNDELDIKAVLANEFDLAKEGRLPKSLPGELSDLTFWASFHQRPIGS